MRELNKLKIKMLDNAIKFDQKIAVGFFNYTDKKVYYKTLLNVKKINEYYYFIRDNEDISIDIDFIFNIDIH
jgi:hypothetical protein